MDLEEARKKLRKAETRDASAPRIGAGQSDLSEAEIRRYQATVQEANIEEWERQLGDLTFATRYVQLSVGEGQALHDINKARYEKRPPLATDLEVVAGVQQRVQRVIESEEGWAERGVFVKTSSRSAKDAAIAQHALKQSYVSYLKEHCSPPYGVNDKIKAVLHAGTQMLRCPDAEYAMRMLCQSERVEQDMRLALEVYREQGHWNESLAIREWVTIDISQEWRCFVHEGRVTAVSQYNYLPRFPALLEHREYLEALIPAFIHNEVLPRLPEMLQSVVVDVALTGDVWSDPKCWVIELNPFLASTDPALFSWAQERAILEGQREFELRLQETESVGMRTALLTEWREFIDATVVD